MRQTSPFLWDRSPSKRLAGRDFISSFISSKFLNCLQKQKEPVENNGFFCKMAERGGFEPPEELGPSTDFESAAFDHSATSPLRFSFCPSFSDLSTKTFTQNY